MKEYALIEDFLLRRFQCPDNPLIDADECGESIDALVAPYVVESTRAQVSMTSAISLVNRYCQKLPSDIFTRLVPQTRVRRARNAHGVRLDAYCAELVLPINSPLKRTITIPTPMKSKAHALMAVALEVKRLFGGRARGDDRQQTTHLSVGLTVTYQQSAPFAVNVYQIQLSTGSRPKPLADIVV